MGATQLTTRQLGGNAVNKDDIDTTTTTKALITKVIAGTNITISSTGVDTGTGDVTINATGGGSGPLTETALADGFTIAGGTTSRTLKVDGGDVELVGGVSNIISFPFTGTGIFGKTVEVEIDFGSIPISEKLFTITDSLSATTSLITVRPSGNPATNRGSDDWQWDSIQFAAKGNTGNFTVYAKASGKIGGKRKILYTIN